MLVAGMAVTSLGILAASAAWWFSWPAKRTPSARQKTVTVAVHGISIPAEVADTDELRGRGLSGRKTLAEGSGMLFVFPLPSRPGFWMRGMNFPLDFIWIAGGRVSEITADVLPTTGAGRLTVYRPQSPVTAVLEVPAGFSLRRGISVGDSIAW